jgi:hypothetical protein
MLTTTPASPEDGTEILNSASSLPRTSRSAGKLQGALTAKVQQFGPCDTALDIPDESSIHSVPASLAGMTNAPFQPTTVVRFVMAVTFPIGSTNVDRS